MQTFHLFLHIYAKWFRSYKYGEKLLIILHLFAQLPSQLTCTCSKLTIELLKKRCKICSKLTITTSEQHQQRGSDVCIVSFEHISHLFLMLLWIVGLEQVNVSWDHRSITITITIIITTCKSLYKVSNRVSTNNVEIVQSL